MADDNVSGVSTNKDVDSLYMYLENGSHKISDMLEDFHGTLKSYKITKLKSCINY